MTAAARPVVRCAIYTRKGAVSLTLTCLHLGRPKPLTGMTFREADFVQASPISS